MLVIINYSRIIKTQRAWPRLWLLKFGLNITSYKQLYKTRYLKF